MKSHTSSFRDIIHLPEHDWSIHPGWAVKTPDGEWVCSAHGYFSSKDPFYAKICKIKEDAEIFLKAATEDGFKDLEIVVGWEPYCAKLLFEIDELKQANTITPDKLLELTMDLENVLDTLKGKFNND